MYCKYTDMELCMMKYCNFLFFALVQIMFCGIMQGDGKLPKHKNKLWGVISPLFIGQNEEKDDHIADI